MENKQASQNSTRDASEETSAPQAAMVEETFNLQLSVHDVQFSTEELIVNPEILPQVKTGDLLSIYHPVLAGKENNAEKDKLGSVILRVKQLTNTRNLQISVSKYIATVFDLPARAQVIVKPVFPNEAVVPFVELLFKDQYTSRSDMYRLKMSLCNECAYTGKKVSLGAIKAQVNEIVGPGGRMVSSGLITNNTKIIFRSRSASILIFFQMSREMWEFADDGLLYFEKAVTQFLKELFDRWSAAGTSHSVSIIFFSRTYFESRYRALFIAVNHIN
jgi:hypothetical protein